MGEREIYKEDGDVLGEMMKIDECDMEKFGTLDTEKTIAILADIDGGHRRRNIKGMS